MPSSPLAHVHPRNLVTYVAIAAALGACVLAPLDVDRGRALGGAFLAVAALADVYDGRFARMFPRSDEAKRFGVQIDSLSDALSFGIAPLVVLSRVTPLDEGGSVLAFVACAFVYLLSAVTRLAHYNVVDLDDGFVGVPTTVFGLFWSAWLFFSVGVAGTCAALVVAAAAMVSPVRIQRPGVAAFVGITLVAVGLATVHGLDLVALGRARSGP